MHILNFSRFIHVERLSLRKTRFSALGISYCSAMQTFEEHFDKIKSGFKRKYLNSKLFAFHELQGKCLVIKHVKMPE